MMASIGVPKSIELTTPSGVQFPTCSMPEVDCYKLWKNHIIRVIIGLFTFWVGIKTPFAVWKKLAMPAFVTSVGLLALLLIIGQSFSTFANAWLLVGGNSLQPAEIAKLGLIFYLAIWLERRGKDIEDLQKGFFPFCIITGMVVVLLMLQPDLGSTMIFTFIAVGMYFLAGAQYKHLLSGFVAAMLILAILIPTQSYLKHRFKAYINPSEENCLVTDTGEPRDYCWQSEQSNIAIAGGGFFGKGLTKGVQKSYWLPQAPDDFIFAASAEELGFIRIVFIIVAFTAIAYRGFMIAKYAPDRFSMYTAAGLTIWIVGQAYINIAVNTGVLPVTGITLPFISYGGSSLVFTLLGAGILLNISRYSNIHAYVPNTDRRRNSRPHYAKHRS